METIMHKAALAALAVAALSVSAVPSSSQQEFPKVVCAAHVKDGTISSGGVQLQIASAPNANPMVIRFVSGLHSAPVVIVTPAVPVSAGQQPFIGDVDIGHVNIHNPPSAFHFVCIEK
jgi:hypothetical protein